jgi:hypothetical protein
MLLAPKDIQQVFHLNWGVFCTLIRSDIITILACLGLFQAWILITCLLDHAGISPQQRTIIIVMNALVDEWIGSWNVVTKQYEEVEYIAVKITKLVFMSYNSVCLMCCLGGIFCHRSLSAILRKKIGKLKEEI